MAVWDDIRNASYHDIYGARINTSGEVLDPGGKWISIVGEDNVHPAIIFGSSSYLVGWQEVPYSPFSAADIRGARIAPDFSILDSSGIDISTASHGQSCPTSASDGNDYFIIWSDDRSGGYADIYGARVDASGSLLDADGIAISTATGEQSNPAVAFGNDVYLVVWEDERSGSSADIYGTVVSRTGGVNQPGGIVISNAPNDQLRPQVAFDGTDFLVVWEDYRGGLHSDIYGARVTASGVLIDPVGFSVSIEAWNQLQPHVHRGPSNEILISYSSYSPPPVHGSYRIYGRFCSPCATIDTAVPSLPSPALQSYPNPFKQACTIHFEVPCASQVRISIFDVTGSMVRTLVDRRMDPGECRQVWDGKGDDGRDVPPSVYFCRVKVGQYETHGKIVLMK
jgi:hypothetical protein